MSIDDAVLKSQAEAAESRPGRSCPLSYRYSPRVFRREPEIVAGTIYVVGGLYGNVEALNAIQGLAAGEPGAELVFNGDFHWFDVAPRDFSIIERQVSRHARLRGNVETEIAQEDSGAGCGCAYPVDVSDAEVSCSNEILERLRAAARTFPEARERLARLPMNLVAQVGDARVAIVHGDAASLAGWGFAHDRLAHPGHQRWIEAAFRDSAVDVFASTHTCLPALRAFEVDGEPRAVANNGAAGMPNFAGRRTGLVTRIASGRFGGPGRVTGVQLKDVHVDVIEVAYDTALWAERFLASWPEGSPAHQSYWRRICDGPRFSKAAGFAALRPKSSRRPPAMTKGKLIVLVVIAALVVAFFVFDLKRYFSLEYFQAQRSAIEAYRDAHPFEAAAIFFGVYVVVTGLSLPGAAILTLVAGAVFGLVWGVVIVSFASSLGATLAFLASRYLLRDWVQGRFGDKLKAINAGIEREGPFYLFAMRLVPAFPFFAINLLMGVTPIKARTFYGVSQVGMLAGTIAYVYAGTQLGQFKISVGLVAAFVILGIFPLVAKKVLDAFKARKVYAKWTRPASYDNNIVVIGAGSAGLVTSYIAAAVKAKVTLVEKHRMGGDCLNTGCVPSKALIKTAKLLSDMKRSKDFGIRSASAEFDFADVMERVQRVVREVEPHDSAERYTKLGVDCLQGTAKITSPWTVDVALGDGSRRTLTTKNIVIAAGGRPLLPPIPGLAEARPLTSDTVWELRKLPRRLVVLGGGPIGSELAQCFARLGSKVSQVEMLPRILSKEDPEFSELVAKRFRAEGIDVLTGHKAKQVLQENGEKILVVEHEGAEKRIACDEILCAVGRVANTEGYGLEELGIPTTKQKTVEVNDFLQTLYPNIYACGDVAGPYQFTHTASHMAWYCAVNAVFGKLKKFRVDYSVIPWATFTDPEVARVGLSETEAKEKKIPYEVSVYGIDDLDRAIADGEAEGRVKVLTKPGTDRILGVTIAGEHASDILAEYVAAMRHGFGMEKIMGTIHTYPTMSEANKYAAGIWKRQHATRGKVEFAGAIAAWTRGAAGLSHVIAKSWGALFDKAPAYGPEPSHSHGDD